LRGYFGDNLSLGLEVRNRIYFGDVPTIQGDEGLVNMAFYAVRESNFVFNSMIDRLWFQYQKEKIKVRFGRPPRHLGRQKRFGIIHDLFNAYNFIDLD
jgi:hypothetical protein